MVKKTEIETLIQGLATSRDEAQLESFKEHVKDALGEMNAMLCFQLIVNPNYSLDYIVDRMYWRQFSKDNYEEGEIEHMVSSIMALKGSEAERDHYVEEVDKVLPGFSNFLFWENTDPNITPLQVITTIQKTLL